MNAKKALWEALLASVLVLTISGCGGGGDSATTPSPPPAGNLGTAAGVWTGTVNTNRTETGIVLSDGSYWFVYTVQNNPPLIGGFIQGSSTSSNGAFTSSNARDFNFEGLGVLPVSINGSYLEKRSLNGVVTYASIAQTATFTSTYDAAYEQVPLLATIAASYSGNGADTAGGRESANLTVSSSGAISGQTAGGCRFSGTIAPKPTGNAYTVSTTFAATGCAKPNVTITGLGYYKSDVRRLYIALTDSSRGIGYVYIGNKS